MNQMLAIEAAPAADTRPRVEPFATAVNPSETQAWNTAQPDMLLDGVVTGVSDVDMQEPYIGVTNEEVPMERRRFVHDADTQPGYRPPRFAPGALRFSEIIWTKDGDRAFEIHRDGLSTPEDFGNRAIWLALFDSISRARGLSTEIAETTPATPLAAEKVPSMQDTARALGELLVIVLRSQARFQHDSRQPSNTV